MTKRCNAAPENTFTLYTRAGPTPQRTPVHTARNFHLLSAACVNEVSAGAVASGDKTLQQSGLVCGLK